jgi:glycosyltransferase involved in cell wall biosynthesis
VLSDYRSDLGVPFEDVPHELPYGIERLKQKGFELTFTKRFYNRAFTKLRLVIEHRLGFPVAITAGSVAAVSRSRYVLAILEHNAILALLLKKWKIWPFANRDIIVMNCWLADRLDNLSEKQRLHWFSLLQHATLITVWSRNQLDVLESWGIPKSKLRFLPFGVSTWFETDVDAVRDIDVLSVGQDLGRDYSTFFDAVSGQEYKVTIVCKPVNLHGLSVPQNVTNLGYLSKYEYRNLLRRAKVVVVPSKSLHYPTGQTVSLEASMAGAAVVVSNTPALTEYFEAGVTALMPTPGNALELRQDIQRLLDDPKLRRELAVRGQNHCKALYTSDLMWDHFADLL